jgi:DNA-binding NarL/FixJ family response regulator
MAEEIRVLLADDHVLVRQGIRQFLEDEGNIEVVAEADDGAQALRLIEQHQPDIAVLDIRMPEMTGIEATRRIKTQFPRLAAGWRRRLRAQDGQRRRIGTCCAHSV